MLILGIETSCDETGLALVEHPGAGGLPRLVAEKLATQEDVHAVFGGVVPEIASREHYRVIGPLAEALFRDAGVGPDGLDGIAVARGPGLLGSLLVGLGFAKGLAMATGSPLVGVDHCQAHLSAPRLEREIAYPGLGLLVSGGHTQLYRLDSPVECEMLGRTLDDAAGEAFDKVAKVLNLPYPGGRYVDALAQEAEPVADRFTRPYLSNSNLDFSFSGLKTAVATEVDKHPGLKLPKLTLGEADPAGCLEAGERRELAQLLADFTWAAVGTLAHKTRRALERLPESKCLVVAGGVAANSALRAALADVAREAGVELVLPGLNLCTDNGAMIAAHGAELLARGFAHDLNLDAVPRGQAIPDDYAQRP